MKTREGKIKMNDQKDQFVRLLRFCWNCRFWEELKAEHDLEFDVISKPWQGGECSALILVDCNGKQLKPFTRANFYCPGWESTAGSISKLEVQKEANKELDAWKKYFLERGAWSLADETAYAHLKKLLSKKGGDEEC